MQDLDHSSRTGRAGARPAPPYRSDARVAATDRPEGLVDEARAVAASLLGGLDDGGRRWNHTQAVATRAAHAAVLLAPHDADALQAAAWLHDIGYAPALARHGFHPVDGAVHVMATFARPDLAGLVAHHSGARFIAGARDLTDLMRPYPDRVFWTGPVADALTWADQTTGPDGRTVTVEERLAEMLARHGPDSPNARCHLERAPVLVAAVRSTEARLAVRALLIADQLQRRRAGPTQRLPKADA